MFCSVYYRPDGRKILIEIKMHAKIGFLVLDLMK